MSQPDLSKRRNARVALICAAVFAGMVGAAYAAVPLYRAFCQLTGFDGTVRRAEAAPAQVLDRTLTIRFDANVRDMPWDFRPDQVSQQVRIGGEGAAVGPRAGGDIVTGLHLIRASGDAGEYQFVGAVAQGNDGDILGLVRVVFDGDVDFLFPPQHFHIVL